MIHETKHFCAVDKLQTRMLWPFGVNDIGENLGEVRVVCLNGRRCLMCATRPVRDVSSTTAYVHEIPTRITAVYSGFVVIRAFVSVPES